MSSYCTAFYSTDQTYGVTKADLYWNGKHNLENTWQVKGGNCKNASTVKVVQIQVTLLFEVY